MPTAGDAAIANMADGAALIGAFDDNWLSYTGRRNDTRFHVAMDQAMLHSNDMVVTSASHRGGSKHTETGQGN
jgi:hypothetical protein